MLELADRMVSKTIVRNGVWVQVPLPAPMAHKSNRVSIVETRFGFSGKGIGSIF